ncbi:hypothetical protein HII31_11571 [Pseudocercospora fuligena]|uniref:Zn(2)-C6 fungal-type domain-containing protein n=1 Tax=Pseudocercospora fuligena TaxID=685502 RepID=A0A8H6VGC2_9PEZI|nr:hypothetical protein HII31_11571 [Pseudocercospora fuligena]
MGDQNIPECARCVRAGRFCDRNHERKFRFRHNGTTEAPNSQTTTSSHALSRDARAAELFQHYIHDLAAWYDLSDARQSFQREVPRQALASPLLMNAILAFAAIHISCTGAAAQRRVAERYHSSCIAHLITLEGELPGDERANTLAAVCLLRSYEILAEQYDPNRHLYGAYALASSPSIDFSTPSLNRACFFNYLREDITYSLMFSCCLKIEPETLLREHTASTDQDYLNQISLLLGRTINEVFSDEASEVQILELERELSHWKKSLPSNVRPYLDSTEIAVPGSFPKIYMLSESHVSIMQYNIVTQGLLTFARSRSPEVLEMMNADAMRVCSLAFTSNQPAVLVNSYGPMAYLCTFLKSKVLRDELVVKITASCKRTGWPVSRMIEAWRAAWPQQDSN